MQGFLTPKTFIQNIHLPCAKYQDLSNAFILQKLIITKPERLEKKN